MIGGAVAPRTAGAGQPMGQRPDHIKPPAYLSENPPIPEPAETPLAPPAGEETRDPTRYGDWEHKGIAIDF